MNVSQANIGRENGTARDRDRAVVIVVAPQGAGKSLAAESIAARLGCTRIVDEWDGFSKLSPGDLALTNADIIRLP